MNIKRAKEEIKDSIRAYFCKNEYGEYEIPTIRQRPIFLLGAPGIGKTQIMEQIARECRVGLVSYTITHHTRQSAIGLPFISEKTFGGQTYAVTEYTMSEIVASIYQKIEVTGLQEGILFIDEINCVSETLAPAMLQFLQCKTFGNQAIPEGWIIVAAGNPPEYNKSVREFDVVTMDRVKKIPVEPDFEVWKEYAQKENVHPAVLSYLNARPAHFYRMESTVDGKRFATPRGWEDLSRMIAVYEKLEKTVDKEVVIQYLQHEQIAADFANYLELYYKYCRDYPLDEIFAGTIPETIQKKLAHAPFDERLSVTGLILSRCRTAFRAFNESRRRMEMLFAHLKEIKEGILGAHSRQPLVFFEDYLERQKKQYETLLAAELLSREDAHRRREMLETLNRIGMDWKKADAADGETAFVRMQNFFAGEQQAYEAVFAKGQETLEYAFDFMETVFGESQEMVIFITELNTDGYSIAFLKEYECERYYLYNKQLLFRENRREILRKLEEL